MRRCTFAVAPRVALAIALIVNQVSVAAAVLLVDPSHPQASDQGPGSADRPLATLKEAMARFQPGDTLRIAPGLYREPIVLPQARRWAGAADSMIEGLGDDPARWPELRGSTVVRGWQAEPAERGLYSVAWTVQPQQAFVDGTPLRQIGGTIFGGYPERAGHPLAELHKANGGIWPGRLPPPNDPRALAVGTFYFDAERGRVWLRCDCADLPERTVELSDRPYLVYGRDVEGVTVRRLRVRHASTSSFDRGEAVMLIGKRLRIEQLDVQQVDAGGIGVKGEDIVVERSRVAFAGQFGLAAKGRRIRVVGNHLHDNNTRGFNKWWEAGGAKLVGGGPYDSEFVGNLVEGNRGDGIWFDYGPANNLVSGNLVRLNSGFGIHYEASFEGRITGNVVALNGQRGIYLPHSSRSLVAGNLVALNGLAGIVVVDEGRRHRTGELDFEPRGNTVCGNLVAWNKGGAIVLPARLLDNLSDANTVVGRGADALFSLGWWPNRWRPTDLSLDEWRALTGQDRQSVALRAAVPDAADAILRAVSVGATPSAVAQRLGLPEKGLQDNCAKIPSEASRP